MFVLLITQMQPKLKNSNNKTQLHNKQFKSGTPVTYQDKSQEGPLRSHWLPIHITFDHIKLNFYFLGCTFPILKSHKWLGAAPPGCRRHTLLPLQKGLAAVLPEKPAVCLEPTYPKPSPEDPGLISDAVIGLQF